MNRSNSKERHRFWKKIMIKYEESGLKIQDFCNKNNLNFHTFKNWRFRISKKENIHKKKASFDNPFIPLVVNDEPLLKKTIPTHTIDLRLDPSGSINICIPSQFNPDSLSHLLAVLGRIKC